MIPEINTRLIAVRGKLRRSIVLNTNVIYEVCAILVLIILVRLSILDVVFLERAMACRKIPDYLKSTAVGFHASFPMHIVTPSSQTTCLWTLASLFRD